MLTVYRRFREPLPKCRQLSLQCNLWTNSGRTIRPVVERPRRRQATFAGVHLSTVENMRVLGAIPHTIAAEDDRI
jgi:hypothetical protein